uniref:Uncharacterized protein n=1 Tax=Rhizophora mucronata TaxID=61149 RepID=A0A2P2P511_RHIMU
MLKFLKASVEIVISVTSVTRNTLYIFIYLFPRRKKKIIWVAQCTLL